MKKQFDPQLLVIITGGILFNLFFWMEKQAINLLLYSIFLLAAIILTQGFPKNRKVNMALSAHLLAGLTVVFNQSTLTVITWYISLAILTGILHFQDLRSIFAIVLAAILQFFTAPFNLMKKIANAQFNGISLKPIFRIFKYILLPIFITGFFCVLYSIASPVFAKSIESILDAVAQIVNQIYSFIFADLSFSRFLHGVLGILVTAAVMIKLNNTALEDAEISQEDELKRKRRPQGILYQIISMVTGDLLQRKMALKTENIIGILCFLALNVLLFFLNGIDLFNLWLANAKAGTNFSAELHEGTNALIFSIILAMMVILYFFKGNLNFYSKNKAIKVLAYLWIIQNVFLVLSVGLRDFQYIDAHGLTYKRIGVFIFLLLCAIGLLTVYLKVARKRTLFYLCRVNGSIWYALLLVFGLFNWDVLIVDYNIRNNNDIALDLEHMMSMSDKTIPMLDQNRKLLKTLIPSESFMPISVDTSTLYSPNADNGEDEEIDRQLDRRIENFKRAYKNTSWLSWNYRDWQTYQYLIENKK